MTLSSFFAALVADPDALQLAACLVLWLPVAGGLFGVMVAEVGLDLLAWAGQRLRRALARHVLDPIPRDDHSSYPCSLCNSQPSRAADPTHIARQSD